MESTAVTSNNGRSNGGRSASGETRDNSSRRRLGAHYQSAPDQETTVFETSGAVPLDGPAADEPDPARPKS